MSLKKQKAQGRLISKVCQEKETRIPAEHREKLGSVRNNIRSDSLSLARSLCACRKHGS